MECPGIRLILVLVLGHMVFAGGSRAADGDTSNTVTTLQRRQHLDSLNDVDTSLCAQLNVVHTRLNRMESRFDGIETAISDMKDYLQERIEALDQKVELALTDIKPQRDLTTAPRGMTMAQKDVTGQPPVLTYTLDDYGETYADGDLIDKTLRWPTVKTVNLNNDTRLLAFKVFNAWYPGAVGPRAWLSTGFKTDATSDWKCLRVYEEGWNQVGFNDSHWGKVEMQWAGRAEVVGHGAVTVGCGKISEMGRGPYYFRKTLIAN